MKKVHMIAALLALLLPTMALAGGSGSTTYNYSATVNVAASGSGTVYVGAGTSATDKTKQTATQSNSNSSDTSKTYMFTAVAEPEEGYEFTGWTGGADNASSATTPVTVSLSSSTTSKTVDLTATFAKVISFDGAEYVIDENGGELATLLGTVQAGDKIIINKDVTIEKGVSLTIPSGIQVSISSGKKLIVKGGLSIHTDARLVGEGALAHNWKTITQAADVHVPFPLGTDGVAGTGNGVNTVDGTAGKYLVTSVKDGSATVTGSFTCKEEFFVTVENKASGETYYSKPSTSKPVGVLCTVAREKALNWIVGVSENVYTDCATLLTAAATPSGVAVSGNKHSFKDTNKLAVLTGAAGTVTYDGSSSSSSTKLAFTVDLAGTSITLSTGKQWNSQALVRFFNGSVTITQKVMNTNFCVYNCTGKISYLSLNSGDYVTAAYLYESPRITITFSDKQSTSSGELCFFGGGPYSTSYVSFNTTVSDKQAFNKVYWGTFASGMNPTTYLYDTNKVYAEQDSNQNNAWVVKSKVVDPNAGQVLMNGEESTFADAIAKAPANATIVLQKDVELFSDLTLTATGVRIDLNGWKLTGSNAIINNGDLEIIDVNGNGQIDVPVINNGTLLLSSAKYNGPITLNSGFCYFLEGTFNGGVAVASGVEDAKTVAEVCGGTFATLTYAHGGQNEALVGLCENGYVKDNAIAPIPVSYVANPSFASYNLSAFDSTTKSLYTRNAARSGYTREEWIELCKLKAASALFSGFGVDCAVTFDRAIAANDISVNAMGLYPFDIDEAIAANKSFSALFQAMRRSGMATAPWTYGSILPGGAHDGSLSFSLSNKSAQNGTLCLIEMRLATGIRNLSGPKDWSYTEYVTTAKQKLLLGNTSGNKAMIRPASGAATFYATLGAAMDAVADGGTVMLANDCDTALTLNKAGTYTFDSMGFAYSGGEPAVGSGLRIVSQTTVDSGAKVLVPDAIATTYVVENAGTIECGETKYVSIEAAVEASSGDMIAVTVTADDTETVTLAQGKTLTVTVNDGVEANVTVNPGEGSFIETETSGSTTTYVAKQITVEMAEPQSQVEVVKVDHGVTNEVSDASLVNEAVHALTGNHDVSRTDNTDKLDVLDKITVTPTKIVEEVVGADTIIRSVTFDVVPHLNVGQSLGEGQTLKFRLPVDAAATQLASIVYHVGEQFGIYPVQTYANEKFIEVTSADFSPYSYELLDGETSNPIAAIGTTGYATLDAAIAAANVGNVDEITILDSGITTSPDADWKVVGNKLVKKSYVAQIGTAKYETLGSAVYAAQSGDTITLLADIVDYTGTTLVSKSLTINGAGHSITAAAVPEGGHRDMINAFTGGTSMLKIGGGAVTVTNITFNGHATHAYTYLIEVINSGASLTVGDISLLNGGELDNSGTAGAGYGAAIHVNNASLVVKDGFYACTGGAEYGVFPFTGILPEGNASVMFDLVEDSDDTPTVDIGDDLLLVGMIGAIDPDTAQAILDYMKVPSRFIPYTLTLGDGSDYAFTGASPRTWNDIIDYGKEIMDVSTSLGYEGLDKESTPVEVGLLADTELPGTFVFEDANFTVNGNGHELTGTIKYTASAGELKNVILTSDTILDISADGAAVNFGDNVTGKAGEAVTLVVGELSAGQTLATHVDGLSLDSVVLKTWDGDNLVDAAIPEGLVLIKVDGNLIIAAAYEITWVSEGEILAVDVVISNTVPVYAGEPPVKDADDNGIYIFRGWTPKVEAAVSNTTYTANFSNSCTIRWMTGDTIVKSVSVTNGTPAAEIAALAPSGASSPDGNARFAGWSPAVYADALGDADYIAQFEALDTLASIVPGTLRFTAIKVNGRKVAVTFEFKPAGGETDAYRLICKTALDSAETFVSDIANVTLINDDANISIAIAEVQLPEGCENQAFVTGLDFVDVE